MTESISNSQAVLAALAEHARCIRVNAVKMAAVQGQGYIAQALGAADVLAVLYFRAMSYRPADPKWEGRDRCIFSKGHGSISMYPILADLGFFDMAELQRVCATGGFLGGIPVPIIPGYETLNGSLGHGLGVGTGMALGLKRKGSDKNVFVVTGDGELHEGANWEAIMFAPQHKLDNLHLIVDNNSISMLGFTDDIISHVDLPKRLDAFGWECLTVDGHDVNAVQAALATMKATRNGKPKALVARTLKGRGIPNLENVPLCHIINPKPELLDTLLEQPV